jgi:hypothetical protein
VLSSNPFAADLSQAKSTLAFVSCLSFIMISGILTFLRWDRNDHIHNAYVKGESLPGKDIVRKNLPFNVDSAFERTQSGFTRTVVDTFFRTQQPTIATHEDVAMGFDDIRR